ncbi:MAG: glycosyl transferase, partial [Acidimicrobiales bacterium]|nr:glycosyl transferase [Acidimicrobiales bacterium]
MTSTLVPPAPTEADRRPVPAPVGGGAATRPTPFRRLVHGPAEDPAWARPALLALLAGTAVLYLWGLGASGWANSFYSAAAQAGATSWKAMFFGSSDAASFITVDKIPGSIWIMSLSVRMFGLNAWSILVPQALEGVATVGVLYAAVRRWSGPAAGLLAGAAMALTPVAALMFRFNNPDALLVLLLTLSAYALVRALESAHTRWVVLAFSLVGFGFLTKMLQAFLVVPAFGLVYLLAAPTPLRRRIGQLTAGAAAMLVSGGWWVAIVELWPKSSRPYIGGSQNNSVLDLLFGYNGLGRLSGSETGSIGGGNTAAGRWGPTGIGRLFNSSWGGQASWLIPAALLFLVAGVASRGRARRTDRTRAALLLWGGWLLVTAAVFSFSQGIIHEYYAVALAPAIGAIVGIGVTTWWRRRHEMAARALLSVVLVATAAWSARLLGRTPTWFPALRGTVFVLGLVGATALLMAHRLPRPARAGLAALALGV